MKEGRRKEGKKYQEEEREIEGRKGKDYLFHDYCLREDQIYSSLDLLQISIYI